MSISSIGCVERFFTKPQTLQTPLAPSVMIALSCLVGLVSLGTVHLGYYLKRHNITELPASLASGIVAIWHKSQNPTTVLHVRESKEPMLERATKKVLHEIQQQKAQIEKFSTYAKKGDWSSFHSDHYDWWCFPINRPSRGYGEAYNFSSDELRFLRDDVSFMASYQEGVRLVARSWGWDVDAKTSLENPSKNQTWRGYGVRLAKMAESLKLLGETELWESMREFAVQKISLTNLSDASWVLQHLDLRAESDGKVYKT
jgi:hypothetical protein